METHRIGNDMLPLNGLVTDTENNLPRPQPPLRVTLTHWYLWKGIEQTQSVNNLRRLCEQQLSGRFHWAFLHSALFD